MNEKEYLIWSFEHYAWWGHNGSGYTNNRSKAGVYSAEAAHKIVSNANAHGKKINEAMVPTEKLPELP